PVALLDTTSTPVMLRIVLLARATALRTASLNEFGELPTSSTTLTTAPSTSCPGMPTSRVSSVRECYPERGRRKIRGRTRTASEEAGLNLARAEPRHAGHARSGVDRHGGAELRGERRAPAEHSDQAPSALRAARVEH